MLGSAESQVYKLITREIIFEEFQRMWSQSTNVTDGQTDSQKTYHGNTALRYASRGKKIVCNWLNQKYDVIAKN